MLAEEDAGSEASELMGAPGALGAGGREEGGGCGAGCRGGTPAVPTHAFLHGARRR